MHCVLFAAQNAQKRRRKTCLMGEGIHGKNILDSRCSFHLFGSSGDASQNPPLTDATASETAHAKSSKGEIPVQLEDRPRHPADPSPEAPKSGKNIQNICSIHPLPLKILLWGPFRSVLRSKTQWKPLLAILQSHLWKATYFCQFPGRRSIWAKRSQCGVRNVLQ